MTKPFEKSAEIVKVRANFGAVRVVESVRKGISASDVKFNARSGAAIPATTKSKMRIYGAQNLVVAFVLREEGYILGDGMVTLCANLKCSSRERDEPIDISKLLIEVDPSLKYSRWVCPYCRSYYWELVKDDK